MSTHSPFNSSHAESMVPTVLLQVHLSDTGSSQAGSEIEAKELVGTRTQLLFSSASPLAPGQLFYKYSKEDEKGKLSSYQSDKWEGELPRNL